MEIAKENCRFAACNEKNQEYKEQKSKHVICLMGPATQKYYINYV